MALGTEENGSPGNHLHELHGDDAEQAETIVKLKLESWPAGNGEGAREPKKPFIENLIKAFPSDFRPSLLVGFGGKRPLPPKILPFRMCRLVLPLQGC